MRACLAILKDSFREAAASRVLWIALVAIVVLLLALAPLGLTSAPSTQLRPFELVDTQSFLEALAKGKKEPGTPAGQIRGLMSDDQKNKLEEWLKPPEASSEPQSDRPGPPGRVKIQSRVLDLLNGLIRKPEFYRPENWSTVEMEDTLRPADDASVVGEALAAKNLKRLAAAFTQSLAVEDEQSLSLTYGTMVLFGPLQASPQQTSQLIDGTTIVILSVFFGFFGVFSSLLITASIIPRTFEPGEISLLLSKPVQRAVLFVTKFIGGCAFTLLCAIVLVTGIWLLLWSRFGMWRPELLLCIPLYVFLFAVYFSVSALAGAIWRNATVSLSIVVAFWVVVTTAGAIHNFMNNGYFQTQQIVEVAAAGSEVFVVDGAKKIRRWDPATSDWLRICDDGRGNSLIQMLQRLGNRGIRPRIVATIAGDKILALQSETSRFGDAAPATLFSGEKENNFLRETESITPEPVFAVFINKEGQIILPGTRSIYRYDGVSDEVKKTQAFLKKFPLGLFSGAPTKAFELLSSRDMKPMRGDSAVAFNPANDLIVYSTNGSLVTMVRQDDGKYITGTSRKFEKEQAAVIASGGEFILCAMADGEVLALDAKTLETVAESSLESGDKPKVAEFAGDGSWGVVMTHGGKVLSFTRKDKVFVSWTPQENGHASAVRFDDSHQLIVANGRRGLSFYKSPSAARDKSLQGVAEWPYDVYDYVVFPLYTLLPKPSEVDNVVRYLVTGEKSEVIGRDPNAQGANASEDLGQQRVTFDLWKSFWSNLGFIAVMLFFGCLYLIRHDF